MARSFFVAWSWASTADRASSIPQQDAGEFRAALEQALAINPDEHEDVRLANLVAQERARWLLDRTDDLILEEIDEDDFSEGAQR